MFIPEHWLLLLQTQHLERWEEYYFSFPSTKMFRISFVKRSERRGNLATWVTMNWLVYHILMHYAEKLWECMHIILSIIISANGNWNPGIHLSLFNPERKVPRPSFPKFLIHRRILNSTWKDTILPLSTSIIGLDGQEMNEIPIPNNTNIIIAIYAANRNPEIWGSDSYDWKPERWLDPPPESVTRAHIPGVYSHLYVLVAFCNALGPN